MGKTYFVPRSVKGETRILNYFTIKSFIFTVLLGLVGAFVWYIGGMLFNISLIPGLIIVGIFGAIGYIIGAVKIPDSPYMGKFRKAGGEYIYDIIFRFLIFKSKKKIYVYNLKRNKGGN